MISNKPSIPFKRHAIVLALALSSGAVNADTISVSASCSLVTAINNANTDTDTDGDGGCAVGNGADTITLPADSTTTLTTVDNNINGPNGLPVITSIITINGNNPTIERSSVAGTPNFRIFNVTNTGSLSLNNITVTGGKVGTRTAGGIRNQGFLTLVNSTITGNKAGDKGAGIKNIKGGSVTITNSTISNNSSASNGGGIDNSGGLTITSSTIFGNSSALDGGGISNTGTLKITNGTLSSNTAFSGGGLYNHGALTINNSTINDNSIVGTPGVGTGGGINNATSMDLKNTIIGNSVNGSDCGGIGTADLTGVNFIEDGTCGATLTGTPNLFALLNNGGTTLTHSLKTTSPALEAATSGGCSPLDQRGVNRPQPTGGVCDAGSFELITTVPTSVTDIIGFYDTAITGNTIKSVNTGTGKSTAVRNQLLTAGNFKDSGKTSKACDQLNQTLPFIDPDNSVDADDYVTGTDGANLVDEINALITSWACP